MAEPIRIVRAPDLGWIAQFPADGDTAIDLQDQLAPLVAVLHQIALAERRDVWLWDDLDPPAGWVCAWPMPSSTYYGICGRAVESERCPEHGFEGID